MIIYFAVDKNAFSSRVYSVRYQARKRNIKLIPNYFYHQRTGFCRTQHDFNVTNGRENSSRNIYNACPPYNEIITAIYGNACVGVADGILIGSDILNLTVIPGRARITLGGVKLTYDMWDYWQSLIWGLAECQIRSVE